MDLNFLEDSSLIDKIAYRGDTRSPEIIFREGFWNKQTPDFVWRQMFMEDHRVPGLEIEPDVKTARRQGTVENSDLDNPKRWIVPPMHGGKGPFQLRFKGDPEGRKYVNINVNRPDTGRYLFARYIDHPAQYRDQQYHETTGKPVQHDINQNTAVCLTLEADVAPYFPIDGTGPAGGWCWIYAVRLYTGIKTYRLQRRDRSSLAFAREVAVQRVPSTHVLCAVRCWRSGKYPAMQFNLLPRIWWNPGASSYELARSRGKIVTDFSPLQAHRVQCPTNSSPRVIVARELILEGPKSTAEAWT